MTSEQFIYWLQGFLEISGSNQISETQVQIIRDHISLVLQKKTPERTVNLNQGKDDLDKYQRAAFGTWTSPGIMSQSIC